MVVLTPEELKFFHSVEGKMQKQEATVPTQVFLASIDTLRTNLVQCTQCHSTKITYRMLQTRCADEAMTTIYKCQECQRQWSNSG